MTTTFVAVQAEDRPGTLGKIARALAKDQINIEGFATDKGTVRLLCEKTDKCMTTLKNAGFKAEKVDVFGIQLPNKPGQLADIGEQLGKANVNIVSSFGCVTGKDNGVLFIRVDNVQKAEPILSKYEAGMLTH